MKATEVDSECDADCQTGSMYRFADPRLPGNYCSCFLSNQLFYAPFDIGLEWQRIDIDDG